MPESRSNHRHLLEDLLVQRSMEPLDDPDAALLERLLEESPDTDATAFDRAATAVWLALTGSADAMPTGLRQKILQQAAPQDPD